MAEVETSSALSLFLPWLARHGQAYQNADGEVHLTLPERLPYIDRDDTATHVCKAGERLFDIAIHYFKDSMGDYAVDCWEIIAQFQEDPIVDGSVTLPVGLVLLIPSDEYIQEVALGEPLHEYPRV